MSNQDASADGIFLEIQLLSARYLCTCMQPYLDWLHVFDWTPCVPGHFDTKLAVETLNSGTCLRLARPLLSEVEAGHNFEALL